MSNGLRNHDVEDTITENRRLIYGVSEAIDIHHARFLEAAMKQWERNVGGSEPSDACVNVRINSGDSQRASLPCAGVRRKRGRSLLNGSGHPLPA